MRKKRVKKGCKLKKRREQTLQLKPCKRCNAVRGMEIKENGIGDYYVECPCGARTSDFRAEDDCHAVRLWNAGELDTGREWDEDG